MKEILIGVLNKKSSIYSDAYQLVLDKADVESLSEPSQSVKFIQNNLMIELVNSGDLGMLDFLYIYASDTVDKRFGLINWCNPSSNYSTLINDPDWQTFGFSGVPLNVPQKKYITLNYNPLSNGVNYTQNDCMFGCYQYSLGVSGSESTIIGNEGGRTYLTPSFNGDLIYSSINSSSNNFQTFGSSIPYTKPSSWIIERNNSTEQSVYNNNDLVGTNNQNSSIPFNASFQVFNTNGSSDSVVSAVWGGRSGVRINQYLDDYINALSIL